MNEHVPFATIASDEAVAFRGVEPLDPAGFLDRRVRAIRCRRPVARSPWCDRRGSTAIDAQYFGDVRPFVAGTNTNFENVAGLYHPEPVLGQHGSMQESVAGPIEEFDEAEAFLGTEPSDRPLHGRAGWCLEPGLAGPGSDAEYARLWVIGISVGVASA